MGTTHNHQGTLIFFPSNRKGEHQMKRFHGIDRHLQHSTIAVLDEKGKEINFMLRCTELKEYIGTLGPEDAVVIEASAGSFYWADQIETRGAECYVIDPYKFKIIRDSWKKTDKHDARNLAKALWVYCVTGEFGIPTVYKPDKMIRELRQLFNQYQLINRQIRMLKNHIQATCIENGIFLKSPVKERLFSHSHGEQTMKELELSPVSQISIEINLELLWKVEIVKARIAQEILRVGECLKEGVKLLMAIKGITPFVALAFFADIGAIERFKSLRKMNAYLGLVPRIKESGGQSKFGHINRESRKLARTLLTQSIPHAINESPYLKRVYEELRKKRGVGRARIAMIRKLCGMMRRMLLTGECYRWMDSALFERKSKRYEKDLKRIKLEYKST